MNPSEETTVNITLKIRNDEVISLENYLGAAYNLISFEHIPNTDDLYKNDPVFKKMVQDAKKMKRLKLDYVRKHNN